MVQRIDISGTPYGSLNIIRYQRQERAFLVIACTYLTNIRMRGKLTLSVALVLVLTSIHAQNLKSLLRGKWSVNSSHGRMGLYGNKPIEEVNPNFFIFSKTKVEFSSGIFQTEGTPEDPMIGRYPWCYCGNYFHYSLKKDSISFHYPNSENVLKYFLKRVADSEIFLINRHDSIHLVRERHIEKATNKIARVYVSVFDPEPYLVYYSLDLSAGMLTTVDSGMVETYRSIRYRISSRHEKEILARFEMINWSEVANEYHSNLSENRIIKLKIEFEPSGKKNILIIGDTCPRDLMAALIPFIYVNNKCKGVDSGKSMDIFR